MAARNKAVAYAEDVLGVHEIYAEVLGLENQLRGEKGLLREVADNEANIRSLEKSIADRTIELRIEKRGDNPEMSATAFEAHLKVVVNSDPSIVHLTEQLERAKNVLDAVASEAREVELAHRSRVARLNMLGGYLQYLASAKNASTAARTAGQDWPY